MRVRLSLIAAGLLSLFGGPCLAGEVGAQRSDEETTRVIMRGRAFIPERTVLHQQRRARLVFQNQDSELHAFAPVGLFTGVSFHVSGNGAPEFGSQGLTRVIIPAEGSAEIHFTPTKPGEYRYTCDMPGHQMNGIIVVE
jgi:hypothetical protein